MCSIKSDSPLNWVVFLFQSEKGVFVTKFITFHLFGIGVNQYSGWPSTRVALGSGIIIIVVGAVKVLIARTTRLLSAKVKRCHTSHDLFAHTVKCTYIYFTEIQLNIIKFGSGIESLGESVRYKRWTRRKFVWKKRNSRHPYNESEANKP